MFALESRDCQPAARSSDVILGQSQHSILDLSGVCQLLNVGHLMLPDSR